MRPPLAIVCLLLLAVAAAARAEQLRFPETIPMLRATDFGVDLADNGHDDTAGLQKAVTACLTGRPRLPLYLPAGVYNVSRPILPVMDNGKEGCRMVLYGEDRARTIIRLRDRCDGFQDPAKPAHVLATGSELGQNVMAFDNYVRNLTIDVGRDNPGAVGINLYVSNMGSLLDVDIIAPDGRGHAGIQITRSSGPGLVKNVRISGFDYGIYTRPFEMGMTYENITLHRQRVYGILNAGKSSLYMHHVVSDNAVPVYFNGATGANGPNLLLVGGTFTGGDPRTAAIVLSADAVPPGGAARGSGPGSLYLRDITAAGYGKIVDVPGDPHDRAGPALAEYTYSGFTKGPLHLAPDHAPSLRLDLPDTPTYHTNDPAKWVVVEGTTGQDVQQAIDRCPPGGIVFVPVLKTGQGNKSSYDCATTLRVRGHVRKVAGFGGSSIRWRDDLMEKMSNDKVPLLRVENLAHQEPVILEQLGFIFGKVEQNSANPLAVKYTRLKSPMGFMHPSSDCAIYNAAAGTGPIFLEDNGAEVTINPGGTLYARQLNSEYTASGDPQIENRGTAVILSFKTEQGNPATIVHNHPGARLELLGFYNKPLKGQGDTPAIVNEGAFTGAMIKFHLKSTVLLRQRAGEGWKDYSAQQISGGDCPLFTAK